MMVVLVVTVWNEAPTIRNFMDSIVVQTVLPHEAIIVDGGSTDGTVTILKEYAARHQWIRVVERPGANIAEGRNIGISLAESDVIAVTDAGCILQPDWLEHITHPFLESSVTLVGGFYYPETHSNFDELAMALTLPIHKSLDRFIPSSRSFAFRKTVWVEVGGYPEWLRTAEDTTFVLRLMDRGHTVHVAKEAVVTWQPRRGCGLWKQHHNYSRGDGHARLFPRVYWSKVQLYVGILLLLVLGCRMGWLPLLVALGLYVAYSARYMVRAHRVLGSEGALLLTPVVLLFLDSAALSGYIFGILEGRPRPRKPREAVR